MKIISLQAENFKRIRAVEIRPDGNFVQITGKNKQGKSSVLDAILAGLGGERNIQMVPIRIGCEQASIKLDIGEYKITRRFKMVDGGKVSTDLKVENIDGKRMAGPQDLLNAMVGDLSFDPSEFERMKPADQFDTVKIFVPGIDFAELAKMDAEDREDRTTKNRRAKELRAQADGITLPPGPTPQKVDITILEKKLGDAANHNSILERRKAGREQARANILRMRERLDSVKAEAIAIEASLNAAEGEYNNAEALPEPIDVATVQGDLGNARQANATAVRAEEKANLNRQAQALEDASADITKNIEKREEKKKKAIAAAKMPVPNLGFGDGFVTLGGVPFEQASDAERLRAALAIATALNPKLRVIRIREGSRFDEDALKEVASFADREDMQVWVELVGKGPTGFILEDGHLQGEEPEEEEAV
jgi:DNA repair exonuclease SbcCD ATPase subunit